MMSREAVSIPGIFADKVPVCAQPIASVDEEAFCALYKAVAPSLQGYLRKTCRNTALAEDILQETFYRLIRAELPEMDAAPMKAYLFKIATSLLIEHWRHERRLRFWKRIWQPPALQPKDPKEDVSRALSELRPVERSLVWLAYVEGFDHKEIAAILGLKEKSIRVLLFRSRKKLARILEPYAEKERAAP
jgi:RNA polymerase sigma-70 factor (ECF subfamily)